jgi:hypothetical protein
MRRSTKFESADVRFLVRIALWRHVPLRARVENPQDRFKRSPRRNCLRRRAATRARERASARVVSMPIRGIIPLINRVGPVRLWRTQGDRVSPRSLLRRRRTEMASMQRRFNSTGSKRIPRSRVEIKLQEPLDGRVAESTTRQLRHPVR